MTWEIAAKVKKGKRLARLVCIRQSMTKRKGERGKEAAKGVAKWQNSFLL